MHVEEIMIASAHAADTFEGKTQQTFRRQTAEKGKE